MNTFKTHREECTRNRTHGREMERKAKRKYENGTVLFDTLVRKSCYEKSKINFQVDDAVARMVLIPFFSSIINFKWFFKTK